MERVIRRPRRLPAEIKEIKLSQEDLPLRILYEGGKSYIIEAKPKGLRLEKSP